MRLINADELRDIYSGVPNGVYTASHIVTAIDECKTVEAVPMRRTKPVIGVSKDQTMNWWQCGNCESVIDHGDRYCRGCGAEVDWNGKK